MNKQAFLKKLKYKLRELKKKDWKGIALTVASAIMIICSGIPLLLKAQFQMNMSTAVGIIGGADGPTSIFVAGDMGTPWELYIATIIVVMATVVYFVKKYKE